ncbi:hypothetical protein Trydic_g23292 [Trypoxylus dichotomus]
MIQGRTNLNFNEPHFIQSSNNIYNTKDIIRCIKENLHKGCTELMKTCEETTDSDTTSSITGKDNNRKPRKRLAQKTNLDKDDKDDLKQLKTKKRNVEDIINYSEGGEALSVIKLSQIFADEQKSPSVSIVNINNAKSGDNSKRKKRRRRRDVVASNSSLTLSYSKCDVTKVSHGDATPAKTKPRKIRMRHARKRDCSGDESDIEDSLSTSVIDQQNASQYQLKPRRKLRTKHPGKVGSVRFEEAPDIKAMVCSTIARLDNVKNSVQKVIEESLSSGSSRKSSVCSVHTMTLPIQNNTLDASVSSLNWSTVTMTNNTSQISVMTQKPSNTGGRQVTVKKTTKRTSIPKTTKHPAPEASQPIRPSPAAVSVVSVTEKPSAKIEDIAQKQSKKTFKQRQQGDSRKVKDEIEKALVVEREISVKKKKSVKVKEVVTLEPVPSVKKIAKKKKGKKKDHVNFNIPDTTVECSTVALPQTKPAVKSEKNQAKQLTPSPEKVSTAKKAVREEIASGTVNKAKADSTRRVNSAKIYRNVQKKGPAKVKSTGNLTQEQNNQPITVRSVLENEAKNLKELKRQRKSRSRSRSNSRSRTESVSTKRDTSQSRHIMEIYQKVRSNTNSCIASINEQMSCTLKEGIAHLNDICGKVRTTLTDMEKDEENYQKLKSKKSFDVSSEGGSVHDGIALSVQISKVDTPPPTPDSVETPSEKTGSVPHTYTIITESRPDMDQLINTISMGNNIIEKPEQKCTPTGKRRSSRGKKIRSPDKSTQPPSTSTSKSKLPPAASSSMIKTNPPRIPIWQRTPPSIIEEIQLTVKKQATKSQYKEFLRALKNIARKQRSQVHIMPRDYKETMERQHDKFFGGDPAKQVQLQAVNRKRNEEAQPRKLCQHNPTDSCNCNCGVVVENALNPPSQHRMHWMHIRTDSKKVIQAYDILDEITLKDLEPIQSEYPRKDHICDTDANKRIEETLLYKLLYNEDPKVLESLLRSSPPANEHKKAVARLSTAQSIEKQKTASNAYKLYEQLEFNVDRPKFNSLNTKKASMCITMSDVRKPKPKERPRALHSCSREFNDEVNIPFDLKPTLKPKMSKKKLFAKAIRSDNDRTTSLCKKRIEDKLKIIGKKSSIKSIGKRIKGGKLSRENIKVKLKNYSGDSKMKIKKILTVMPVTVLTDDKRLGRFKIETTEADQKTQICRSGDLQISAENKEKIMKMSKREIVHILKPYIFHDFQAPAIIAMPVVPKYNHQAKQQKQDHTVHMNRTPTFKRVSSFLKDHDEDCRSGRKLCRRCQMSMQCGDETKKSQGVTTKRSEPLSPKQLWKNKYRPTPAENLINKVLGKNTARRKFEAVPPGEKPSNKSMVISMSPKELNRSATNTRNKLREVRNIMEIHKTFLGKDLDDIIDTLEFRIVDALSNPKNQRTDAFNEIEHEIKSILQTISELKELNKVNVYRTNNNLKSKTSISLEGSKEKAAIACARSNTDTDLLDEKIRFSVDEASATNIWQNPIIHAKTPPQKPRENLQIIEEMKNSELESTYCSLGKDIRKVIEGLDAIICLDEQDKDNEEWKDAKQQVAVQVEFENNVVMGEEVYNASECERAITTFCRQVDEVIKTIGDMDQLHITTETVEVEEKKSDEYLTPFMRAVKDYRQSDAAQSFIDFLDKLAMISKDTVSVHIYPNLPMYTATIQHNASIVEISKTYNQAIEHTDSTLDKGVGTAQSYVRILTPFKERQVTMDGCSEHTLSTNQWIQTDECDLEFMAPSREDLVQSASTPDVEEYMKAVQCEDHYRFIYDKRTQTPGDESHCFFVETRVEESQVSSDLIVKASIAVGDQDARASIEVSSAECQVLSSDGFLTDHDPNSFLEQRITIDKINSMDTVEMEKYANCRLESTLGMDLSDITIDEYPRNIYTESHISRDNYEQITDSLLCEKRNSYPVTNIPLNKSDIISLFESRKSCSRDFLDEGFAKCPIDSYDSMLARYASSVNPVSSSSSAITTIDEERTMTQCETLDRNESINQRLNENKISKKSKVEDVEVNKLHKHLLHSVYGIVFTLVFLGFNLNYSCCS